MYCTSKIDRILLLGSGGHCGVVADALHRAFPNIEIGIVAKDGNANAPVNATVVGCDADLPALYANGWKHAFVAVGSVGDTALRVKLSNMLDKLGFEQPAIIDPTAVISPSATVMAGAFIGACAIVNSGAVIGRCAIVNSGALVEHECTLGEFAHAAPRSILCGQVTVGAHTHVGAGSVLRQGITVGDHTLIGMGSVVTKDLPSGAVAFGNPCRIREQQKDL